ncbi:MAG TPA: hypothetical protein VGJ20_34950 [Xanthobacteraceae bacterium]|jgi:hypothetical protein
MTGRLKLTLIAALAAVGFASPAFAQSFDPEVGSGNLVASVPTAHRNETIAVPSSGLYAYASVRRVPATSAATDPIANGGGNSGYNAMLLKY